MLTDLDLLHLRSIMQQQVKNDKKDLINFEKLIDGYEKDEVIKLEDLKTCKISCEASLKVNTQILQKIERVLQIKNFELGE